MSNGRQPRTIKVGRISQRRVGGRRLVFVPLIRLSGKWLDGAGFVENSNVEVVILHGEIRLVCNGAHGKVRPPQRELFG
jgi:hypothetical protein